jgi:dienelactone hydrolase
MLALKKDPLIRTRRLELAGAPAILVFRVSPEAAAESGVVLLYHGFSAAKLANLAELRQLAEAGFLAVGIDAVGHGARRYPDFDQRFAGDRAEALFNDVVAGSVDEVPEIVDHLVGLGLSDGERLGIAGVSMGGYIAYGAVLAERRFRAAATIVSSPIWRGLLERSPHRRPEAFFPTALFTITAGRDELVDPEPARQLVSALAPYYATSPERLAALHIPEAQHLMAPAHWRLVAEALIPWFERFVSVEPPTVRVPAA